ncbi:maltose/moltooligosaccharide transporter [Parabacteroides sp. PF5-5]|uniref:MFS transporter n=1 Tax=unclassified Parabacteroides TaxID=2649774 RepID=UPI002474C612|nr:MULTISPECIES: MFS transporter [unclassified Parabacteroides]MDH6303745.1 maltose/moltooligosaccharide transporter [Parabacteroides sp. PH5-39]MDH6314362.1 maltose/moltooligosaccharide transporter [Parabacteroides sp. PF5-13]MDH6318573.1 maltose/moltooligosaccharide transporter [Parabacteroides sp. PH5-13]MDH6322134.1 maltose/moltooligosaccharide transporter [Parabacteroides sp. PH5-8]MDH6325786.1 maltose/moltooligosaccharide transporter [Parabacteroides sp. PH5-41]
MKKKPFLSFWQIWNMTFGFLGIQFGFALQNANSSRILQTYGADVEHLSLFWLAAPLTGMIIQPIVGHYSDRTWCKLGRRRPFFLVGAILTTIALVLMPNAGLFLSPETTHAILSPVLIGAGMLMIMDASINITMEPFRALVGDMLPDEQHTTGFSIQTFLIGIGAVVGSWLPSIMHKAFGFSNTAVAGEVADNVKYAFYAGAAILFLSVLWTILKTKEYSPQEMAEFNEGRATATDTKKRSGFMEIMHDIAHMPKVMWQLGLCQFFAWFALYSMWVYTTPALAEHVYASPDPASSGYATAGDKVGELFGIYNFVAMLFALLLIPIAKRIGRKMTHAVCLCLGGAGLISLYLLTDTNMMIISMIGIGIAWASILAMPYAILSDNLPPEKMGTYMGIFNFFITLPQITNGVIHGWIVRNIYSGHTIYALLTGGFFLFFAAAAVFLVKKK